MTEADAGPMYLSFNDKVSPDMATFQQPTEAELEEMRQTDPPLKHTWAIWEQIMATAENKAKYAESTHRVASFNSVKSFWSYWNHLPQPSVLLDGKKFVRESDGLKNVVDALMIFREGVKPEWEDDANKTGGHFQFQLRPDLGPGVIDEYWNNVVLGMVAGIIEPSDMVTGVRLVDKLSQKATRQAMASIRIEVWFRDCDETEQVEALKKSLERCMASRLDGTHGSTNNLKIEIKPHSSAPNKK